MRVAMSTHLFAFGILEEKHLDLLADAGFDLVELWGMPPHMEWDTPGQVERFGAYMKKLGIELATIHLPFYTRFGHPEFRWLSLDAPNVSDYEMTLSACKRRISDCERLGGSMVVLHGNGSLDKNRETSNARYRKGFDELLAHAEKHGVRIAIENIMTEGSAVEVLRRFVEDYDPRHVGLCLDTGHAHISEAGIVEAIEICGERLITTHIADNRGKTDEHLLPFAGTVDWPAAFRALVEHCPNLEQFCFEPMYKVSGDKQKIEDLRAIVLEARRVWDRLRRDSEAGR
jgi:sugar phosphate isomerase/epimerase